MRKILLVKGNCITDTEILSPCFLRYYSRDLIWENCGVYDYDGVGDSGN